MQRIQFDREVSKTAPQYKVKCDICNDENTGYYNSFVISRCVDGGLSVELELCIDCLNQRFSPG